jgi:hypothetical protein
MSGCKFNSVRFNLVYYFLVNSFIAWILAHIALSVTLFAVLLILIVFFIYRCCQVRKMNKKISAMNRSRSELFLIDQNGQSGNSGQAPPRRSLPVSLFLQRSASQPSRGVQRASSASRANGSTEWVDPSRYNGNLNPEEIDLSQLSRSTSAAKLISSDEKATEHPKKIQKPKGTGLAVDTGVSASASSLQNRKTVLIPDKPKSPTLVSPTQASPRRPYTFAAGSKSEEEIVEQMIPGTVDSGVLSKQKTSNAVKAERKKSAS